MSHSTTVRCYSCGHRYRYLGRTPHSGRCPCCDSHCVSPAGEVTFLAATEISTTDERTVTVLAIDERYRHFQYCFEGVDGTATLTALYVGGHVVRTRNASIEPPVPAEIRTEVERHTGDAPPERCCRRVSERVVD